MEEEINVENNANYTTADYLNQLVQDLQDIRNNINIKGVPTDNSDTFTSLAPKILNIPQGGGGDRNIYKVSSIQERDALYGLHEDDNCFVYANTVEPFIPGVETSSFTVPKEAVVLSSAITNESYGSLRFTSGGDLYGNIEVTPDDARIMIQVMGEDFSSANFEFTSNDGITYTPVAAYVEGPDIQYDSTTGTVTLQSNVGYYGYIEGDPNVFGNFMTIGSTVCEGMYSWKSNAWVDTYLGMTATPGEVYSGKTYLGNNGVESGTLGTSVSSNFDDVSAELFIKLDSIYNNMNPKIILDQNDVPKDIKAIPVTSSGKILYDTSQANGYRLFAECTEIEKIPDIDTSNMTNAWAMFSGDKSLKSIGNIDTSNMTAVSYLCSGCSNLVDIPNFNFSNASYTTYLFSGCSNLVNIPNLDLSSSNDYGSVFANCTSITDTPNIIFNTSINRVISMYSGCTNLVNITDNSFIYNSNMLYDLFSRCPSLNISINLNLPNATNVSYMFKDCDGASLDITDIHLPKVSTDAIFGMIGGSSNNPIHLSFNNYNTGEANKIRINTSNQVSQLIYNADGFTSLPYTSIPNSNTIQYLFAGCYDLVSIGGVYAEKASTTTGLFLNCNNLTTIDTNVYVPNSSSLASMFEGCRSLTTIPTVIRKSSNSSSMLNFSGTFANSGITNCGWNLQNAYCFNMFRGCTNLTTIDNALLNGSAVQGMFWGCTNLTTLTNLRMGQTKQYLNSMFRDCTNLQFSNGWNFNLIANAHCNNMFENCTNIYYINRVANINEMGGMFKGCTNLIRVNTITAPYYAQYSGLDEAFAECTNLQGGLPSFVFSINGYYNYGINRIYLNCSNLTSINTLDSSVYFGSAVEAFKGCTNLVTVGYMNIKPYTEAGIRDMFKGCNSLSNSSLNQILRMCCNITFRASNNTYTPANGKYLEDLGFNKNVYPESLFTSLSYYSSFIANGWNLYREDTNE
ncbi:MAG: BspA family leucine-rich repeat surface protein [Bacilli bacterium]|nr:BspA family leucine-rich repeat surface protein [Bacilli bacterium]